MLKIEYVILDAWDSEVPKALRRLEEKVRACFDFGWRPLGGACLLYTPPQGGSQGLYTATQTMIRRRLQWF